MFQVWKGKRISINLSVYLVSTYLSLFHLFFLIKAVAYCTIVLYLTLFFNNMYVMKNQLWFLCLSFVSKWMCFSHLLFLPITLVFIILLVISYSYFHQIYKYLAIVSLNVSSATFSLSFPYGISIMCKLSA